MPPQGERLPAFSGQDAIRALKRLGFRIDRTKGKGDHYKAYAPPTVKIIKGQRPFIIVYAKKNFKLQDVVVQEVRRMGFPKEDFLKALKVIPLLAFIEVVKRYLGMN